MKTTTKVFLAASLFVLGSWTIFALDATANPGPIPPPPGPDTTFKLSDAVSGVTWLFLVNIILNLFFLTAFLYLIAKASPDKVRSLPKKAYVFLLRVLTLAVIVTAVGALVDYWLVMGIDESYDTESRVIVLDAVNWALALVLILLSVALPSIPLIRLTPIASLALGALMVIVNSIWWVLSDMFGFDVAMLTMIFGFIALPALLKGLVDFHQEHQRLELAVAGKAQ